MAQHVDRYIKAETNGGWPFAAFIIAVAVVINLAVFWLHSTTYYPPTDLRFRAKGAGTHAEAGGHDAADSHGSEASPASEGGDPSRGQAQTGADPSRPAGAGH